MKNIIKRITAVLLALVLVLGCAACSGETSSGKTKVTFMYNADGVIGLQRLKLLIDTFNETVGAEKGIEVVGVPKAGGLENILPNQLPSNGTPDLVALNDQNFKLYIQYYQDLTDYVTQEAVDNLYPNSLNRYRYNTETKRSDPEDPLYGITWYNEPTVLYYNTELLTQNGITIISVHEEDLDAFNAGTLADETGKTKADYGITIDVPAKGFYRSENPYVPEEGEIDGSSWIAPADGELLIFNDCIAMNWDELDDIAMICTKTWNPKSASQYGFYTEWWFNYGWSIGGDCIEDVTGNGEWRYSLPSDDPNYIVNEGCTYTGLYTGTVYAAGETLDIKDILLANPGDAIDTASENNTTFYYTVNGQKAELRDFSAEISDGTLDELPSIRTAVKRFYSLAGQGGKNVCPYPSVFASTSSTDFFGSEKLAFLIQNTDKVYSLDNMAVAGNYRVAMMPRYKTYTDPTDPNCDEIETLGRAGSHSFAMPIIMSARSSVKEEAGVFLSWVAIEGQTLLAENGNLSASPNDADIVREKYTYLNADMLLTSTEVALPADWWYMRDNQWINIWANPLNGQVRNGTMSFDQWVYQYIDRTNEYLEQYKTT